MSSRPLEPPPTLLRCSRMRSIFAGALSYFQSPSNARGGVLCLLLPRPPSSDSLRPALNRSGLSSSICHSMTALLDCLSFLSCLTLSRAIYLVLWLSQCNLPSPTASQCNLPGPTAFIAYKFKFRIPSYFSLVIRSLAVLEGIAVSFNPEYKVLGSTYPWIARKVLSDSSPQLKSSLEDLLYKDGVFRIDRLESLLTESLRAKTEKALVKQQSEGADSRLVMKEILSFTLTEKGEFVREIVVQEFAKGLDALGLATLETAAARVPFSAFFFSSLMTEEDIINLRTFQRLMLLLSGTERKEDTNTGSKTASPYQNQVPYREELSLVLNQIESIQDIFPLLSIIPELPPESQQQLLQLPANLVRQLLSRAAARTIRRVFL